MKKVFIGVGATLLPLIVAFALISGVFASPGPTKHVQTVRQASVRTEASVATVSKPAIICPNKGQQLVNVTYKISNDADSGDGGNYWAYDAITRQLQIWVSTTGPNQYCADIKDTGTFTTQAGVRSPGSFSDGNGGFINGGVVDGTEVGTVRGGAVFTITGTFHANDPKNWPATGSTGSTGNGGQTLNAGCVITPPAGTINSGCAPVTHNWETHYFASGFVETGIPVWGWSYIGVDHAGAPDAGTSAGRWNNFITGDSGDILDVD
ncbi:MAG TPA: hypothetical protein VEU97_10105 [Ktedonobacteraceae bacterium]|nr:hypothetical protein [Ktedonobacteraceae bacterium]